MTSVAARSGYLSLSGDFAWIGESPAMIAFAVATVLEIAAYYVPWLDNLLDTVASPAAVVAGIVVTASVITGMDPTLKWILAAIAGGGVAGLVQTLTVGARQASTLATAGLGNPLISTAEIVGSLALSAAAVALPLLAGVAVVVLLAVACRRILFRRTAGTARPASQASIDQDPR